MDSIVGAVVVAAIAAFILSPLGIWLAVAALNARMRAWATRQLQDEWRRANHNPQPTWQALFTGASQVRYWQDVTCLETDALVFGAQHYGYRMLPPSRDRQPRELIFE